MLLVAILMPESLGTGDLNRMLPSVCDAGSTGTAVCAQRAAAQACHDPERREKKRILLSVSIEEKPKGMLVIPMGHAMRCIMNSSNSSKAVGIE